MCLVRKWIVFCILLYPTFLFPQSSEIEKLELNATTWFHQSDSLYSQLVELATESEIIAQRIQMYQEADELNPRQYRNLEKQMQNAQVLEIRRNEIQSTFNESVTQFQHVVEGLIQKITLEIDSLAKLSDSPPKLRDKIAKRLRYLVTRKQKWAQIIEPVIQGEMPAFAIQANPWDSKEKLSIKGDLLLDQEERLRTEVQLVDKRIKLLEDEKRIRTKVSELASSMDIFNEDEELMNQLPINGSAANTYAYWNNENLLTDTDSKNSYRSGGEGDTDDIGSMPFDDIQPTSENENPVRTPETIQRSIHHLLQFRNRIKTRADSLNQRANWFHQQANKNQRPKTD